MTVIWKYPLVIRGAQEIEMPIGAQFLCVQVQQDKPCIWAQVDPDAGAAVYQVFLVGTGHEVETQVSKRARYLGTVQMPYGLVFHVYVY